jgi:hypothetical protein
MLSLSDYGVRSCILEIQVKMGPCGHILEHSYLALQGKGTPVPILLFLSETTYSKLPFEERLCAHTTY